MGTYENLSVPTESPRVVTCQENLQSLFWVSETQSVFLRVKGNTSVKVSFDGARLFPSSFSYS